MHMCCNSSSLRLHGFSRPCPFRTQRNACPAEAVTGRFRRFIITSDSHGEMRSSTNQRRNHPQINGVLPKKRGKEIFWKVHSSLILRFFEDIQ